MSKSRQDKFAHERQDDAAMWDAAIARAQEKIGEAEQRIVRLNLSIKTFEEMRDRGEPFPREGQEDAKASA